jgi:hypothetical protein
MAAQHRLIMLRARTAGHERGQHAQRHPVRQPTARSHHAIAGHKPRYAGYQEEHHEATHP